MASLFIRCIGSRQNIYSKLKIINMKPPKQVKVPSYISSGKEVFIKYQNDYEIHSELNLPRDFFHQVFPPNIYTEAFDKKWVSFVHHNNRYGVCLITEQTLHHLAIKHKIIAFSYCLFKNSNNYDSCYFRVIPAPHVTNIQSLIAQIYRTKVESCNQIPSPMRVFVPRSLSIHIEEYSSGESCKGCGDKSSESENARFQIYKILNLGQYNCTNPTCTFYTVDFGNIGIYNYGKVQQTLRYVLDNISLFAADDKSRSQCLRCLSCKTCDKIKTTCKRHVACRHIKEK